MATYAIGDVHGRPDLLEKLLAEFEPTSSDHVVFLGDYIDRGPDSRGVVDVLLGFEQMTKARVSFLLGNHEQWLLQSVGDRTRHSWILGMDGLSTIRSYSREVAKLFEDTLAELGPAIAIEKPELPYDILMTAMPATHASFFRRLSPYVRTEDVVCVHAGVSSKYVCVEDESEQTLCWATSNWWRDYDGSDEIVYGHWGNARWDAGSASPLIIGRTYGIDCVESEQLLAIRFPDKAYWAVS